MTQKCVYVPVRLTPQMVASIDKKVSDGKTASRSEYIRNVLANEIFRGAVQ